MPAKNDTLWDELDKAVSELSPQRPANSFTVKEFSERYKIGETTAKRRIALLVSSGKAKRIKEANGRDPHYYSLVGT